MAIKAFRRRFIEKPQVSHLDAWIVSPGGVGTTFVMEYIASFATINDPYDADGLKHWPKFPNRLAASSNLPVVFITGDKDAIVASIKRRDWLQTQSAKIGGLWGTLAPSALKEAAFKRAVERQIASWAQSGSPRILVVDYDDIWSKKAEIAGHLGLDIEAFCADFPARKQRESSPATRGLEGNAS